MILDLTDLLNQRLIVKCPKDLGKAKQLINAAEQDLIVAESNINNNSYRWALAIAYSAMVNVTRAIMFAEGYRTFNENHHYAIVLFCNAILKDKASHLVGEFNRYRLKRHKVIYGEEIEISKEDAEESISEAKKLLVELKKKLK